MPLKCNEEIFLVLEAALGGYISASGQLAAFINDDAADEMEYLDFMYIHFDEITDEVFSSWENLDNWLVDVLDGWSLCQFEDGIFKAASDFAGDYLHDSSLTTTPIEFFGSKQNLKNEVLKFLNRDDSLSYLTGCTEIECQGRTLCLVFADMEYVAMEGHSGVWVVKDVSDIATLDGFHAVF